MIKITFPDGSVREYNEGVTGLQMQKASVAIGTRRAGLWRERRNL